MGSFNDYVQQHGDRRRVARELELRCPSCGAMNRPGATIIELETERRAVCGVCGRPHDPTLSPT